MADTANPPSTAAGSGADSAGSGGVDSVGPGSDAPGQIDVNPATILEKVDSWVDGFIRLLPNIGIAILIVVLAFVISALIRSAIVRSFKKKDRSNLGEMVAGFTRATIIVAGFLTAATVVMPTLKPGDIVAGLGVSSVAIGFAFKDILQNWLAGMLILLRQPFEIGDQIEVNDYEGTVEHIETRATLIRSYDGKKVVVPNSEIYTNSVVVKTAHDLRRSQYDIGIGYGDDLDEAVRVLKEALQDVPELTTDRETEVLPWDLAASWVTIRIRWWTDPTRSSVITARMHVIQSIKKALDEAHIDMPYETYVQLVHNQTEEIDGDRSKQREGWPVDASPSPAQ